MKLGHENVVAASDYKSPLNKLNVPAKSNKCLSVHLFVCLFIRGHYNCAIPTWPRQLTANPLHFLFNNLQKRQPTSTKSSSSASSSAASLLSLLPAELVRSSNSNGAAAAASLLPDRLRLARLHWQAALFNHFPHQRLRCSRSSPLARDNLERSPGPSELFSARLLIITIISIIIIIIIIKLVLFFPPQQLPFSLMISQLHQVLLRSPAPRRPSAGRRRSPLTLGAETERGNEKLLSRFSRCKQQPRLPAGRPLAASQLADRPASQPVSQRLTGFPMK